MKHLKWLVCSIVVLYCSTLYAQDGGVLNLDNTYSMYTTIQLSDGNYAGLGSIYVDGTVKTAVIEFEPDGDIIWQTLLGSGINYYCNFIIICNPIS